jgi:Glu-tRNA(Gln) amidotransferase subunit E-like FAD-binding protein
MMRTGCMARPGCEKNGNNRQAVEKRQHDSPGLMRKLNISIYKGSVLEMKGENLIDCIENWEAGWFIKSEAAED